MITTPSTHRLASDVLVAMLDDARQRTFELTQDLPIGRHLGPKLSTVNPLSGKLVILVFFMIILSFTSSLGYQIIKS